MSSVAWYVSKESVQKAIDYFKNLNIISGEQLGLFFLFKGIGLRKDKYIDYKDYLGTHADNLYRILYKLSALFDKDIEIGRKRTCVFPFSFKDEIGKKEFYNGATEFKQIPNRIKDTMDNTLVDEHKFLQKSDLKDGEYRFDPDYLKSIKEEHLNDNKISFNHFVAWYFRFSCIPMDFPKDDLKDNEKNRMLTRVLRKKLKEELNISDREFSVIFQDDDVSIKFSNQKTSGYTLRQKINFKNGYNPDIDNINNQKPIVNNIDLKDEETVKYMHPNDNNISIEILYNLLLRTKQSILSGPPGTGKSHIVNELINRFDFYEIIQFHPNLSYENFIGGLTFDDEGSLKAVAGTFLEFCYKAHNNSDKTYLFVIDEINRGNLSKIFGEVILTLDREYKVSLAQNLYLESNKKISQFSIPENVYIIGTMNTADRSIAIVDYAIRRRFSFVKFTPNYEVIKDLSSFEELSTDITPDKLLKKINDRLLDTYNDLDILLGQSYFLPSWIRNEEGFYIWDDKSLMQLFNYYIVPLIEEYTYGNSRDLNKIIGDNLQKQISNESKFINAIDEEFKD